MGGPPVEGAPVEPEAPGRGVQGQPPHRQVGPHLGHHELRQGEEQHLLEGADGAALLLHQAREVAADGWLVQLELHGVEDQQPVLLHDEHEALLGAQEVRGVDEPLLLLLPVPAVRTCQAFGSSNQRK